MSYCCDLVETFPNGVGCLPIRQEELMAVSALLLSLMDKTVDLYV